MTLDTQLILNPVYDTAPLIIGVTGHARSGKDTVASILETKYAGVYTEAFASALKDSASALYRIPREMFDESSWKEKRIKYWEMSPREIAQMYGTEIIRLNLGKNHWVRVMHGKLTGQHYDSNNDGMYVDSDTVIITDVRFDNEAEWILENGGYLIHLTRPGAEGKVGIPDHASEAGLSDIWLIHANTFSIINNGTLKELDNAIEQFIDAMNLRGRLFPKDTENTTD